MPCFEGMKSNLVWKYLVWIYLDFFNVSLIAVASHYHSLFQSKYILFR